jgi:hypothetical protein
MAKILELKNKLLGNLMRYCDFLKHFSLFEILIQNEKGILRATVNWRICQVGKNQKKNVQGLFELFGIDVD